MLILFILIKLDIDINTSEFLYLFLKRSLKLSSEGLNKLVNC